LEVFSSGQLSQFIGSDQILYLEITHKRRLSGLFGKGWSRQGRRAWILRLEDCSTLKHLRGRILCPIGDPQRAQIFGFFNFLGTYWQSEFGGLGLFGRAHYKRLTNGAIPDGILFFKGPQKRV